MIVTIDFETHEIIKGFPMPPEPVGVAVKIGDCPSEYHEINDDTYEDVCILLRDFIETAEHVVMHNSKFDAGILACYFDIEIPVFMLEDTMFMAYLNNPREESFGLKQLAEKHLGMPPDEQDDLKEWVLANVPEATKTNWGAYIARAPVDIVSKYAKADTDMTKKLYDYFLPVIQETTAPGIL